MQKTKASLLLHPLFLCSLATLIFNDCLLKYTYPGWVTGKLSDFAGMLVLPVFCRVLFPKLSVPFIVFGCTIFFTWWKSPLSQPLIDFLNNGLSLPIQRVVDYSDLVAFLVLHCAVKIKPKKVELNPILIFCFRWSLGLITFVSLCSTSVYRPLFQAHAAMDDVYFGEDLTVRRSAAAILQTLDKKGIAYRKDSVMYYPIVNQQALFYKTPVPGDSLAVWQPVSQKPDSTLYIRWQGSPFYLIPFYQANNKTFRNIRFTLRENKKATKTTITIQMFVTDSLKGPVLWNKKTKRVYQQALAPIFSE